ncbi:MAG: GAF domain-containing protein [Desulfobacterales bacterium]|nr:GAF domain-containing protein [Desulfobacterales bacterium]
MKKLERNYETLLKITGSISHSKNPQEVALMTVESIATALNVKGCTLFLVNRKTHELKVAASYGLSNEYINKGPLSSLRSISQSLLEGPVAIYNVADDPRIQYPEEAKKEGIASILSVPIIYGGKVIGALRVYTSQHWEFTLDDVNFVQALAQIAGMAIYKSRLYQGQKESIRILKTMREAQRVKSTRRTPHEGVPVSVPL